MKSRDFFFTKINELTNSCNRMILWGRYRFGVKYSLDTVESENVIGGDYETSI